MRVRVATLNAWALPEPLSRHVPERMRAIGDRLRQLPVDVVALQEVWSAGPRDALVAAGRAAGLAHAWHRDAALGGSGLLVLSRLPILDAGFERFSLRGFPERLDQLDFYGGKGFAIVRVATPAGPLALVDTHLHARYPGDHRHGYRGLRTGQIVEIAAGCAGVADPLVAVGDFNLVEAHREYRVLTGLAGLRDAAIEADRRQPTTYPTNPYRSRNSEPKRKDYVFVRDGDERRVAVRGVRRVFDEAFEIRGEAATFSDHAGVLAELELLPGPVSRAAPDPEAASMAAALLAEGRADAERRQRERREVGAAGFGVALVAAAGLRSPGLSRRRLLRLSLQGLALLSLPSGVGGSLLSEVYVEDELRAFERLSAQLARVEGASVHVADASPPARP